MRLMSSTRDTSHVEMSPLKDVAPMKMALMSVMLDTSHSPIGPCAWSEQSRSWDNLRQLVTALLSSGFICGENNNSPAQKFSEMEIEIAKAKQMT